MAVMLIGVSFCSLSFTSSVVPRQAVDIFPRPPGSSGWPYALRSLSTFFQYISGVPSSEGVEVCCVGTFYLPSGAVFMTQPPKAVATTPSTAPIFNK